MRLVNNLSLFGSALGQLVVPVELVVQTFPALSLGERAGAGKTAAHETSSQKQIGAPLEV